MSVELAPGHLRTMGGADAISYTDPLTGLGNRTRLREKITKLVRERSLDPAPFTIGLVNIDGFRPINDLFGRTAGDDILCQVAHRLRACMPQEAVVTRLENDAFAFVLPLVFDETGAERISELFQEVLSAPYDLGSRTVRLSSSLGLAIYPYAGEDYKQLMENVDTALYRSKRRGRGQVTLYSADIADEMKRTTQVEQSLRRAVITHDMDVLFQPIVDLRTGVPIGFEALARWYDEELGEVSPGTFIPLAEERGIIESLTDVLLKKAARAALNWPDDKYLSFNLSSVQLVDPSTHGRIMAVLAEVGLEPSRLGLEITETAVMADAAIANDIIDRLHEEGVSISLDDFGTGQSSLGRLREISLDKVKIDRAFVSEITRDRPSEHIVKAIIALCEGLDLEVIAEGIETVEQAAKLLQLGCVFGQGYLYGRPMSASDVEDLILASEHYS